MTVEHKIKQGDVTAVFVKAFPPWIKETKLVLLSL